MSEFDLVTRTPCCCTCCGRRETADAILFWTCTCAMSGSVPFSKIAVMFACPRELDCELK
ncbi:hypothetical protein D3C85_1856960 [compost metagenome]